MQPSDQGWLSSNEGAPAESVESGEWSRSPLVGHRGWLLVYTIALVGQILHAAGLAVAAAIVYANPSLGGLDEPMHVGVLAFYLVTNGVLIAYGILILVLMANHRHAAIAHNVAWNVLSLTCLVAWFVIGAKSPIGVVVDSIPAIVSVPYLVRSRRVANTYCH